MPACRLVKSEINHTRHGAPSHFLARRGLSLLLDLDDLEGANRQSACFSVNGLNILSFNEADYGPNFKSDLPRQDLAGYARRMAQDLVPGCEIATVLLLTFPRIFGLAFNPVSVYVLRDKDGRDRLYIYEVRNTFGDMHSYIGSCRESGGTLQATKIFHVSPFFPTEGEYRLKVRAGEENAVSVLMRYMRDGRPQLTATLRGSAETLTTKTVLKSLLSTRQWPLRPLASIHVEAAKLWFKRVPFFRRPTPPVAWSRAKDTGKG